MRKVFLYTIIVTMVVCASCSRDEADLFDQSAAERSQAALDGLTTLLPTAENGWEMIMFPTATTKGYNLIVKFNPNGTCICAAKNETTTAGVFKVDSTGMWQTISNQGPCLSFDTYNSVLHAFSDPVLAGQTKGVGMKGDFEYLILKASADEIILKGKKRSTYNLLRPLPSDQNWETYFDEISTKSGDIFKNNNLLTAFVENKKYSLYNGSTGVFELMPFGEPYVDTLSTSYPFAFTQKGICLMHGFVGREGERVFDLENNIYYSGSWAGDQTVVSIAVGDLGDYMLNYCNTGNGWKMLNKNVFATWKPLLNAIKDELFALTDNKKDQISSINFGYKTSKIVNSRRVQINGFVVQLEYVLDGKAQSPIDFTFSAEAVGDKVTLTYVEPSDESSQTFLASIPSAENLVKAVSGTYSLTTNNPMNPTFGMNLTNMATSETASISYSLIK